MGYYWFTAIGMIMDINGIYPLLNCNRLLLKMAIDIVDLPMKNSDSP